VKANLDTYSWTFGCEHEWADWDQTIQLPNGWGIDRNDVTMVNSDGIAVDPKGISWKFGGELNSPPTSAAFDQGLLVENIRSWLCLHGKPTPEANYRSNLHVHVRVPGLRDDLDALKKLAAFGHFAMPILLLMIEEIPKPDKRDFHDDSGGFKGAMRRYRRRLVSHHTVITGMRLSKQLAAPTVTEFFAAECPSDRQGLPLWHLAPRHAVNLRHLREATETIEFRHFPGSTDPVEVEQACKWCRHYLDVALGGGTHAEKIDKLSKSWREVFSKLPLPWFREYDHSLEERYRLTCHDGTLTRAQIEANIAKIQRGEL